MTRSGFTANPAQRSHDQSRLDIEVPAQSIPIVSTTTAAGGIRGFASFYCQERPARSARDPRTGGPVAVQARRILPFKPASGPTQRVNITSFKTKPGRDTRTIGRSRLQLHD